MHKIKNWMCRDKWFDDNNQDKIKRVVREFCIEDSVYHRNHNTIQLDFTSLPYSKRTMLLAEILEYTLNDNEFFFCELYAIGINLKHRYIKIHPNKENCVEYRTLNEDIVPLYDNLSFIRVDPNTFRFKRFAKDVFTKNGFINNYLFIDEKRNLVLKPYDERGIAIASKAKEYLRELFFRYEKYITSVYHDEIKANLFCDVSSN